MHLAYTGIQRDQESQASGLQIQEVTPENLRNYIITECQSFSSSEEAVAETQLDRTFNTRMHEMAGEGRFALALQDGEPAATIGWYEGEADRFIFMLGTRASFRRRGLARALLSRTTTDALDLGKRSVIINGDPDDFPVTFYQRFGFADEVCRHESYLVAQ